MLAIFLIILGVSGCKACNVQTKDTNVQQGSTDVTTAGREHEVRPPASIKPLMALKV